MEEALTSFSAVSWAKFREAASIRQDRIWTAIGHYRLLTAHDRASLTNHCHNLAGVGHRQSLGVRHKEPMPRRAQRDEDDVGKLMATIRNWMNPFTPDSQSICSLSSGCQATPEVEHDLLAAHSKGLEACKNFVASHLVEQSTPFFDPSPKMKLRTMKSLTVKKTVKTSNGVIQLRADRSLFARLTIIAQTSSMDMRLVLSFPLGPLPWSLACPDGAPVKTNKAKLLHYLEKDAQSLHNLPADCAWIVDGMAVLQSLSTSPPTFADLAAAVVQLILARHHTAGGRVGLVFDCYWDISIKAAERNKRSVGGGLCMKITSRSQKCPKQWAKVLKIAHNKREIIKFFTNKWQNDAYAPSLPSNCFSLPPVKRSVGVFRAQAL